MQSYMVGGQRGPQEGSAEQSLEGAQERAYGCRRVMGSRPTGAGAEAVGNVPGTK